MKSMKVDLRLVVLVGACLLMGFYGFRLILELSRLQVPAGFEGPVYTFCGIMVISLAGLYMATRASAKQSTYDWIDRFGAEVLGMGVMGMVIYVLAVILFKSLHEPTPSFFWAIERLIIIMITAGLLITTPRKRES